MVVLFVLLLAGGVTAAAILSRSHNSNSGSSGTQASAGGTGTQTSPAGTDTAGTDTTGTGTAGAATASTGTGTTPATSTASTPSTTTTPPPSGACLYAGTGVQLKHGLNLSCPFSRNIVTKLAAYSGSGSSLSSGPATFEVSSPATGQTYAVTCSLAGNNVNCHNNQSADPDNGHGNNNVVFPASLVR